MGLYRHAGGAADLSASSTQPNSGTVGGPEHHTHDALSGKDGDEADEDESDLLRQAVCRAAYHQGMCCYFLSDQGEAVMFELLDQLLRTFLKACRELKIRRSTSALIASWFAALDTINEAFRSAYGGPYAKTSRANRGPIIGLIDSAARKRAELILAEEITSTI